MERGAQVRRQSSIRSARVAHYDLHRQVAELDWLRSLAHSAPVAIFRADARGICSYVNERWSELTGHPASAALGASWQVGIHPDDVPLIEAEWQRCLRERVLFSFNHRYLQPNGRIVWVLSQLARDVDGRGQPTGYTGMTTDITELRQMRDELERSHQGLELRMRDRGLELQRMAQIVETVDDAVVSADLNGRILSWNGGAEAIFGYTAAEMLGQGVFVVAAEVRREEARRFEETLRSGGEIRRFEGLGRRKDGAIFEMAISGFPLRDAADEISGSWAIMRDISERKQAERQLQHLSRRLLAIQDDERRRIARELHDSTAQTLAALLMQLSALAREDVPPSETRRRQLLADCMALADEATNDLRTTAYLLHPPLLDERGLPAALTWFAAGFSTRSGIEVKLDIAADFARLPTDAETALFRIVQESLHNVRRHSGSARAEVRLTRAPDAVVLEVRDHGIGPPADFGAAAGVGIVGMRERLLQFGGTLAIERAEPGMTVTARLPLEP